LPTCLKTLKLINYINLAEIVKNFTNFACGIGEGPIKFPRSSNRFVSAFARVFDGFTVFCSKKTIDGERFLKRIQFALARVVRLSAI